MSEQNSNSQISVEKVGRCGVVTLKRPEALNALSYSMIVAMLAFYEDCLSDPHMYGVIIQSDSEKAYCAGGDVRAVYELLPEKYDEALKYFHLEYQNNWLLQQFNKPNIALVDGIVMGGGVGISAYGTHCVMTEKAIFAMPEVTIGLFPDIGASYLLANLPGETGMYLGLTGKTINAADCYELGIASHTIKSESIEKVRAAMIESDPIDPVLDNLHIRFDNAEIPALLEVIDRVFHADSFEEIMTNLSREANDGHSKYSDWARDIEDLISEKCPLSLKVTFRKIKEAKSYETLKDALNMDLRNVSHFLKDNNFTEGVRAKLVDKTNDPQWSPEKLRDVTDELVDGFFEPLPDQQEFKDIKM